MMKKEEKLQFQIYLFPYYIELKRRKEVREGRKEKVKNNN